MRSILVCLSTALLALHTAAAEEPSAADLAERVVAAAGGKDKLLTLVRIKERLNVSSDPEKEGNERVSVLEPPDHWWVGTVDRVKSSKEPAIFLVWTWTLGAIVDPKSKLELLPEQTDGDQAVVGLRVSGTIDPPLEAYFTRDGNRLVRIDWRSDIHRFSDWKEHDGVQYASKCVGYKKASGKPWYFTEILELERLKELPAGLMR